MDLNQTSMWKVMTIWISQELSLFNFEHLDILCTWIGTPTEKLWPFEFLESFCCLISSVSIYYAPESDLRVKSYDNLNFSRASVVQFQASRYIMRLNRTSESKVIIVWVSQSFNFQFQASPYTTRHNRTPELKVIVVWIGSELQHSISSVSIYYGTQSDIREKIYCRLNLLRASAF